ncbi:MAG: UDP-N-acetylglucosamine 2-epimerase [Piscinibacter sp.]|nr:UDP-N-acetylglucosamine 2-epimerase [Piscinibacter sp.]
MYESHFGISGPPFQLAPDPHFYFDSHGHHDALAVLRRGLVEPGGFVVVSGEIGAGKTTLVRTLLAQIDTSKVVVGQVLTTQLDDAELLRAILLAFGAPSRAGTPAELGEALRQFLAGLAREGRRAVLIIDEAQHLERSAFQWLIDLEKGGGAGLQVCLVGQPELRDLVASGDLLALRERVAVSCHLGPLGPGETGPYVRHRLSKVGWTGMPAFDDAAFLEVHRWTQGIPRRINLLCNRIMLACFLGGKKRIDAALVGQTATELRTEIGETGPVPPPLPVLPVLRDEAVPPAAEVEPAAGPVAPGPGATPDASRADAAEPQAGAQTDGAIQTSEDVAVPGEPAAAAPAPVHPVAPPAAPLLPYAGGDARPLLCVAASQGDHIKAAVLMQALAERDDLPVTLLVRCYANNAFERHRELFAGLEMPQRLINLGIAGGTYAGRATELMKRFEFVVDQCVPSAVIVFDGSDAALSCGLVASRKGLPVLHVGAGVRSHEQAGAGDITRRLTDQLADVLYTTDAQANEQLAQESVAAERVCHAGNLLGDALQAALRCKLAVPSPRERLALPANFLSGRNGYGVAVLDRLTEINDRQVLAEIIAILRVVAHDVPLVWTMHASTREHLAKLRVDGMLANEPIAGRPMQSYPSFVQLLANATCVLTDSWNVQEEATILSIPCLTVGNAPERGITVAQGSNLVVGRNKSLATRAVWDCIFNGGKRGRVPELWDGQAGTRIAAHLATFLQTRPQVMDLVL